MIRPPRDESEGSGVDAFVDAYEEAQARDGHADLADFLPGPDHPLYPAVLCELVRVDLEYGWMRGRPRRLEDYRGRVPRPVRRPRPAPPGRLRGVPAPPPGRRGRPSPDEYRRRFGIDGVGAGSSRGPTTGRPARREHAGSELPDAPGGRPAARPTGWPSALRELPEPGSDFAGFRLIRELGRGAFGRVYLARQGDLADRPVALKVSAELPGEPQALAQLQHTHIVPIYSVHRVGPLQAVCMPYFGATTLADVLRDLRAPRRAARTRARRLVETARSSRLGSTTGPRPAEPTAGRPATAALQTLRGLGYVQAVLWIGARLADGLAHAHERGIVHRDLKPANVLLTDDGQPMLLDFNLAADTKLRRRGGGLDRRDAPVHGPRGARGAPRPGPRRPTPGATSTRSGVILFELLTGRHPFPIRRGPGRRGPARDDRGPPRAAAPAPAVRTRPSRRPPSRSSAAASNPTRPAATRTPASSSRTCSASSTTARSATPPSPRRASGPASGPGATPG